MTERINYQLGQKEFIWYNALNSAQGVIRGWQADISLLRKNDRFVDEKDYVLRRILYDEYGFAPKAPWGVFSVGNSLFPGEPVFTESKELRDEFANTIGIFLLKAIREKTQILEQYLLFHQAIQQFDLGGIIYQRLFSDEFIGQKVDGYIFEKLRREFLLFS